MQIENVRGVWCINSHGWSVSGGRGLIYRVVGWLVGKGGWLVRGGHLTLESLDIVESAEEGRRPRPDVLQQSHLDQIQIPE